MKTVRKFIKYWSSAVDNGTGTPSAIDSAYIYAMIILVPTQIRLYFLPSWVPSAINAVLIISFQILKWAKYVNFGYKDAKFEGHKDGEEKESGDTK